MAIKRLFCDHVCMWLCMCISVCMCVSCQVALGVQCLGPQLNHCHIKLLGRCGVMLVNENYNWLDLHR